MAGRAFIFDQDIGVKVNGLYRPGFFLISFRFVMLGVPSKFVSVHFWQHVMILCWIEKAESLQMSTSTKNKEVFFK